MENTKFELKAILDILFRVTNKSACILADCYLLKDKSIISKWKNGSIVPRNDDIDSIVRFASDESTASQQKIIRDEIEHLIETSNLKNELKEIILGCKDFSSFLKEAISVSAFTGDVNSKAETPPCENKTVQNTVAGHLKNNNARYKGTLEFDLFIPDAKGAKVSNSFENTKIEFSGKVNLNPRNKIIDTVKYLKKSSVLGLIFAFIVSGSLFAHSNNQKNNTVTAVQDNSVIENPVQQPTDANIIVAPPTAIVTPTLSPSVTSTPVPTPEPEAEKVKTEEDKVEIPKNNTNINNNINQNISKTENEVNNVVNTTEINININGNENIFFNGNGNAIDIN
mgnify:CR=1 FL=1